MARPVPDLRPAAPLGHVLWIGGPPGAGKTTVASRLARTHGLRLYSADTRTWSHRDRALAAADPVAHRWEALSPVDRWDGTTPQELVALSLHHARGPMVIDDLRVLPSSPLVVAEGSVLPAWAVSSGIAAPGRAVWLLPTAELQDRLLAARGTAGGQAVLHRAMRDVIAEEVEDHGVPSLTVDGSCDVEALTSAVEAMFAGAVGEGPRAATVEERRGLLREANLDVVSQVRARFARPWAGGVADDVLRMFPCECAQPGCTSDVERRVGEAAARPTLAAGHR